MSPSELRIEPPSASRHRSPVLDRPSDGQVRVAPALAALSRPIAELREDPENARAHPEKNLEAIKHSLATFGQQKPIVVAADGTVIAGNGTLRAAKALGWMHLACVTTDLVGDRARGFALADNRTAELAEWDVVALHEALASPPPTRRDCATGERGAR